ncbi:hypothetical protein EVAR_73962_1 [Eumeta japonica]|uniref:Uncharacterized protein n=1 Tax=Eumeta variegata TaxID=151549 RepID=A0A4C1TLZ6_EUMVA|nr:hypothetical protein EVAR_73962_1 [Eumeta japonica]
MCVRVCKGSSGAVAYQQKFFEIPGRVVAVKLRHDAHLLASSHLFGMPGLWKARGQKDSPSSPKRDQKWYHGCCELQVLLPIKLAYRLKMVAPKETIFQFLAYDGLASMYIFRCCNRVSDAVAIQQTNNLTARVD